MSAKQKNITMKNLLLPSFLMLFLTSCLTTAHINYSDPNYLGKDEFHMQPICMAEPVLSVLSVLSVLTRANPC